MMKAAQKLLVLWLIIMFLVTFTSSLVYLVTQQSLRLGANEQPMQLATDTAIKLEKGESANQAVPTDKVDISESLSPFVMVFDSNKNLLSSSGVMYNIIPTYPKGVLDFVSQNGEDRVTWQPQARLRFATVAIKTNDGYIVAGRSLREVEKLIGDIGRLVLLAWLACSLFSAVGLVIIYTFLRKVFKADFRI